TFALYMFFNQHIKAAYRGYSYLFLFGLCGIGSVVGALFAATFVPMFNTKFMIGGLLDEFGYWFTSELQNALLLLPIILNIPQYSQVKHYF
ncbi:sensor domain-containing diguanylate cyclase, partial [Acinetobacter baumannii]